MKNQHFSTTILLDQTPKEVFDAVTNVRGWWSEGKPSLQKLLCEMC
jgi:hypothetical protein